MKTKSLIVAICLLVVSATLLGTASFAWFSMNTEVNVDGIEVEAYSDALFLEISKDNSTFLTSTTLAEGNKTLRLVTPVSVDLTALKSIVATPATGYATSGTYYVKDAAISAGDTYASDNYIKVTTFEAATALATLYRFEFGNLLTAGDVAITGATYVKWNNTTNDYSVVTVNAGASVAGCRRVYSYVKSTDNTVVDGTTYYELNASSRAFTEVSGLVADAPIDQETVYYKKVDGVFALGEGTYTVADDTNNVVYYQRNSGGNYEVASYVTPGTLLDGTYYTIAESVATATVAADSKVWMVDTNGNYICVYHNTSATESVTLNSEKLFWGKSYSDTLGNVGNGPIAVLKDGAVANYVYEDEIYLRSALNTNDGKNLRIDGITVTGKENYLSDAIRIYFVATNQRGGKHVYIYDNGASFTPETLFSDILGNQLEVVTVKMYMYFDGTDEVALTATSAAGELNSQKISVEFAINGVDYTVNP